MNHLHGLPVAFADQEDATHVGARPLNGSISPTAITLSVDSSDERDAQCRNNGGTSHVGAHRTAHEHHAQVGADDSDWDSPPSLAIPAADASGISASAATPRPQSRLELDADEMNYASPPPLSLQLGVGGDQSELDLDSSAFAIDVETNRGLAEIVDGVLLLGPYRDTVDAAECARLGVGAFLCVAAECGPPPHAVASGAPTLHLRLVDEPRERLAEHIPAACAFIDAQAAAGRRTAIFCRKGRSRSVALCAAYVRHRGLAGCGPSALEYVAGRYPRGDPNFWFLQQLGAVPERGFPSPAISADSI